jgi:hypothetical protein
MRSGFRRSAENDLAGGSVTHKICRCGLGDQQFYLFLSFAQRNNVSDPERIAVIEFAEDIVS